MGLKEQGLSAATVIASFAAGLAARELILRSEPPRIERLPAWKHIHKILRLQLWKERGTCSDNEETRDYY
jgi:hypothetical protein